MTVSAVQVVGVVYREEYGRQPKNDEYNKDLESQQTIKSVGVELQVKFVQYHLIQGKDSDNVRIEEYFKIHQNG